MMNNYQSKSNKKGGVISYLIEGDYIILYYKSKTGELKGFMYSEEISGKKHVDKIKKYALGSTNLNSYINNNRIKCKVEKRELELA